MVYFKRAEFWHRTGYVHITNSKQRKHHARWAARVDAAQRIESLSLPAGNRTATTYPSAFAATRSCSSTSFRNNVPARR